MKFTTVAKSVVLGMAVLLASGAFAASKANLNLQSATTINGTQLKPGDYKLQWDGSGPNVEVSIVQGKKLVAKVPAKIVELATPSVGNAAVLKVDDNGSTRLTGARFEGKKYALELGESSDGMQAASK